jgi:Mu transposase, C-terminal domain
VPARFAGRRLEARLGATKVVVLDAGKPVAEHTRSLHKGTEDLVLDHYLEVLTRKPGALAGSTALASARATGAFTPEHQRFWDTARRQLGDGPGTRALVGVLLLHRTLPAEAVALGLAAAVTMSNFDADLVAVEARRATLANTAPRPVRLPPTASQAAALERPAPSLTNYDQLLTPILEGATA